MPVVVLSTVAGDHVPVMPFVEVVGKMGAIPPVQIAGIGLNVGVILGVTVIILLKIVAQPLPSGVKIYVPVVVLLTTEGLQVPVMPLVEVVGKMGAVEPVQIVDTISKVGSVLGITVITTVLVASEQGAVALFVVRVKVTVPLAMLGV